MLYYTVPIKRNRNMRGFTVGVSADYSFPTNGRNHTVSVFLRRSLLCFFPSPSAWSFSGGLPGPIERLRENANRLASGDWNQRVVGEGSIELVNWLMISTAWQVSFSQKIQSVEQQHNRNRALLARMVEGVFAVDKKQKQIFAQCSIFA